MASGSDGSIIIDTDLDNSGFERGSAKLERSIASVTEKINKIGKIPFDSARFSTQVENARDSIAQLQSKLEELGSKSISTADYENVTKSIEKAEQALFRLYDRRDMLSALGVSEHSAQWQRLTYQIQLAEAELERLSSQKAALESSGQASIMGSDTAEYQQLSAALQEASARLAEYEQAQASMGKSSWVSSAVSGLKTALQGVGSAALHAAKSMAKLTFAPFTSGIKAAISGLKNFVTHSRRASIASNGLIKALTSVKTMLISRVKRMFISYIFNEMKEAMNALQTYDKSFGTAMNNMKNSAKMLSANLAVSFGNLITAIEPVLTKIITAISTVISYLNALFAMLGGKSTMTVAKKQMNDYAAAAGGAGGKVEELKRQVYSFDQLNKRSKDSDSGGGGGTSAADLFEEVPISSYLPDSVLDFFNRIKEAFEAGDWEEIGRIVAEGLNSGMKLVDDWINGTLEPLAITWSSRTARMLNGLVEGTDWNLMGKTIADGLNLAFGTVNTFLTTFDFDALGRGFGEGINGAFQNIDWNTVGATIVNAWNDLVYLIEGTITGTDWRLIGTSVSNGLYSAFTGFDAGAVSRTLSKAVIAVLDTISGAIEAFDWQTAGKTFYRKMVDYFANMDYAGVYSALCRALGAAFGGLFGFLWGVLQEAWGDVVKWWKDTAYEDGEFTMEGLLQGIADAISGIGTWIKTNIFDPFITGFKNAFGIASPSKVMKEQGGYVIEGLLNGISQAWGKITSFFSTSLSTLKTTLSNGWNNMKTNASTAWTNIKTSITTQFNTAKTTLSTGVSTLKTTVSNGWNNIKSATTSSWSNISSTVTTKWNGLKSTLQNTNWSSVGSNICSGIRSGINSGWSWLSSTVSSLASSLLRTAKNALGIRSPSRVFRDEVGKFVGLGLAEGIEGTEDTVARTVSNLAQSTVDAFGDPTLAVDTAGADMVSGLDAVASRLSIIASTFQSITAMLNSLGGLNIPQIAVGTVAPPRTRVDTSGTFGGGGSKFDDFLRDFSEFVMNSADQGKTLDDILEAIRRQRLVLDADSFSSAVANGRSTHNRNFGTV